MKKYLAIIVFYDENDWEYIKTLECDTMTEVEEFFATHKDNPEFSHTAIDICSK